ncbi:MAG: hypothetical protein MZV63_46250 [Marinilabiliales bacterium]|nr:hypothetical protein [Marinilabiliales bacterium]
MHGYLFPKIGWLHSAIISLDNAHKEKVPADWHREVTWSTLERYITPELKTYEEKILGAEEKILELELKLYNDLILFLGDYD